MQTQYTKKGETKHSDNCTRVFKNYDMSCPRCKELLEGSPAREGWQKKYYEKLSDKDVKPYIYCNHNNSNPGGYCNTCGNGRDFS